MCHSHISGELSCQVVIDEDEEIQGSYLNTLGHATREMLLVWTFRLSDALL